MNAQTNAVLPINVAVAAEREGTFNAFLSAAKQAGLFDLLTGEGPVTVFAPTDAAFAQFPTKTWADFQANQPSLLRSIVSSHITRRLITSAEFLGKMTSVQSVQGAQFVIEAVDQPRIAGGQITRTDIMAGNGVLHALDGVLWLGSQPSRPQRRERSAR